MLKLRPLSNKVSQITNNHYGPPNDLLPSHQQFSLPIYLLADFRKLPFWVLI